MSDGADLVREPTPRLASDFRRLVFSAAVGAPVTVLGEVLYLALAHRGQTFVAVVVAAYIFSAASSLAYFFATFVVLKDADTDTLTRWVSATAPTGPLSKVQAVAAGTGPTASVQWSGIAIASVVALAISPSLLKHPILVVLSVIVVTTSWLVTMISYAVHYARVSATHGGITFPDDGGSVFWDYIYLSTQIQTTFSASDVTIDTTLTRKIVTGHTVVAFAFNTIIIALLITVVFLGHN